MSLSNFTFKNIATIVLVGMVFLAPVSFISAAPLENGMAATYVLGQVDFASNESMTQTAASMSSPVGMVIDYSNDRLFVANMDRILVYSTLAHENGQEAIAVLGASDFVTSPVLTINDITVDTPYGLALDESGQRLFVADDRRNRVLVFDVDDITNGEPAVNVLGQEDFVSGSNNQGGAVGANTLSAPTGLAYDDTSDLLYVSDSGNNRIVVFDVEAITDGEDAVNVLGEEDFTTASGFVTTATGFSVPRDIFLDEENQILYVSDSHNNRVLVFDVDNITNGEPAVNVLGQEDFVSNGPGLSISNLSSPFGLSFQPDTGYLYVSDGTNARVLVFDISGGVTDGMDASYVLGQEDFDSGSPNWGGDLIDDGRGGFIEGPSQTGLSGSHRLLIDDVTDFLYVSDGGNERVIIFDLSPLPPSLAHSSSFTESIANDGSVEGSIIATLTDDTFVNAGGTLTLNTHYTLTNTPAGLTPVMTVNGDADEATLTFTGNATNHEDINDVDNLTITFLDGAFTTTGTASDVINYEYTTGVIDFNDAEPVQSTRSSSGSSSPQSRALAQQAFADYYASKNASSEEDKDTSALCPADQIITQNLRAPSRNGVYNSYTGGIVTEIHILQTHLNRLGFNSGPVDGIAGPLTDGAIKRIQTFLGTTPDGYVGPITRGLFNTSCGSQGLQTN